MRKDIYNILRERIVNLHYRPGDALNEMKLAEEFQVSRTPIREALIRLSGERLVTIVPHLGARTSEINLRDFQELIELREILERGVARLASRNITKEQICHLEQLAEVVNRFRNENISEMIDCDMKFHQILKEASHNHLLGESLSVVQNQFFRIQRLISHKPERMPADLPKMIRALKKRDAGQMEQLIIDHVEHFVGAVRKYFQLRK